MSVRSALLLLCCLPLFADQVVLKNGDIITGTVIQKDGAKLTLHSEFLNDVVIPWAAVKSLRSDQNLTVVLPSGESINGKVATAGENLEVAGKTAPLTAIGSIRNGAEQQKWEGLQHPSLGKLWAGNYDIGLALSRGNARTTTLTNDFNAARVTSHDKISLFFNEIFARALINGLNSTTASALHAGWAYNRDLSARAFVTGFNTYDHNRFQDLNLRSTFGGGFGWLAVKNDSTRLAVGGGADYEHESFSGNVSRNSAEVNFGDDYSYKVSAATSITQSFRFFPNLSETGAYRFNFDLTAVTILKKWLGWHVTASDHYLSNPLFGRQRNDVLLSTGLRISFAR